MTTSTTHAKKQILKNQPDNMCARGWQDYMIETRMFLGDKRVNDCLKGLDNRQLEKLGLSDSEVRKVRAG